MASGTMQRAFQVKSKTLSGTTDGNGNLDLGLSASDADMILRIDNNYFVFIPFIYQGKWYARSQNSNEAGTATVNHTMNVTIIYH